MSLKADEVGAIARLTSIRLEDADVAPTATTLSGIIDLFEALARVDTTHVEPMEHPLDLVARLREDRAEAIHDAERYQALAPDAQAGLYRVPKVIE